MQHIMLSRMVRVSTHQTNVFMTQSAWEWEKLTFSACQALFDPAQVRRPLSHHTTRCNQPCSIDCSYSQNFSPGRSRDTCGLVKYFPVDHLIHAYHTQTDTRIVIYICDYTSSDVGSNTAGPLERAAQQAKRGTHAQIFAMSQLLRPKG